MYEHTQPGTLIRILVGIVFIALLAGAIPMAGLNAEAAFIFCVMAAIFAIVLGLFHSLTVRVSRSDLTVSFGPGLIRKSFVIDDIQGATAVRNHWYIGWGIKRIRGGWLYNVSGFDAIEIRLKNDRIYRIGTDQPQELLAAIESSIASTN